MKYQKSKECGKVLRVWLELKQYQTREVGLNVYIDGRHVFSRALGANLLAVSDQPRELQLYTAIALDTFETLSWSMPTTPPWQWRGALCTPAVASVFGWDDPPDQSGKPT